MGFFKGVFLSDTCPVASWSSPRTFVQFYLLDVTAPLVAPSVLSQQYTSALRCDSSFVAALPGKHNVLYQVNGPKEQSVMTIPSFPQSTGTMYTRLS